MLAFIGASFGLPNFQLLDIGVPVPGHGQIRIRHEAVALGYVDGLLVEGRYQIKPAMPYVPGGEIAGVVDAIGPDVKEIEVGQRVVTWQLGGGLAEQSVVNASEVDVLGEGVSSLVAASMLVDFQTAYHALHELGALHAGETVLVLGAAGGVGAAAVQLAARAGAFVIAAASTEEKRRRAIALGSSEAVDSSATDWREELRAKAPFGVVDVVFDPVGGASLEPAFRSLAKDGRYLVVGFASGNIPSLPVNLALLKSASLIGVEIRHLVQKQPEKARRMRKSLFSMVKAGLLYAPAVTTFSLRQARDALEATRLRHRLGKVVVVPQM
jgi:NADPH2:quinone reductase